MSSSGRDQPLQLWQLMVLQGLIPIILVGLLLPIGLVTLILLLIEEPVSSAVDRGELFLAAANSAFAGCIVLVTSRTDHSLNAAIASFLVLIIIVLPCYVFWGLLTVPGVFDKTQASDVALIGGGSAAVVAVVVALMCVRASYRPSMLTK